MPNETPFQIALLLAIVAFLAVRIYYRRKTGTLQLSLPQDHPAMARVVLFSFLLTLVATLIWLVNPAWLRWSALPLPGWGRWAGAALALTAALLLRWVHQTLA